MDPDIQADYGRELLTYKLRLLEIQQAVRRLDDSVNAQLYAVAANLGIVAETPVILTAVEIKADTCGIVRRIYRKIKHIPGVKRCAVLMKKIKHWMQQYQILRPLTRLSEKIFR